MKRGNKAKRKLEDTATVSPFAARHGDYRMESMAVTKGEFDDGSQGQVRVLRNRGGTTLERWSHSIDQTQQNAIDHYTRAWRRVFSEQRVVANLSPTCFIRNTGGDSRILSEIDAKDVLDRLDREIFHKAPPHYFQVWQDIVIFDRPAREVGGSNRSSADRAKTICLFIADMIATVERL